MSSMFAQPEGNTKELGVTESQDCFTVVLFS